jgi:hypothetical protein
MNYEAVASNSMLMKLARMPMKKQGMGFFAGRTRPATSKPGSQITIPHHYMSTPLLG